VTLAERQFEAAANMTDSLAALYTLSLIGGEAREKAFARFYGQFEGDALVIDKWFSLQAMIPEESTTERVRGLMSHADFSLANPNRVRALIGAFATGNLTRFHALDGSGYDLLVSVVLELDSRNRRSPRGCSRPSAHGVRWSRGARRSRRMRSSASPRRRNSHATQMTS